MACNDVGRAKNGSQGLPGKAATTPAQNGRTEPNKDIIIETIPFARLGAAASISQVLMLLHRAEVDYLNKNYGDSIVALNWISDLTKTPIVATTPPTGFPVNTIVPVNGEWGAIRTRVLTLISQMSIGLDFYGYAPDNVPLVSLTTYQVAVDAMLENARDIEVSHDTYYTQQEKTEEKRAALDSGISAAKQAIQHLADENQQIQGLKDSAQNEVERLSSVVEFQEQMLLATQEAFQNAVVRQARCTFADVLEAVRKIITVASVVQGNVAGIVEAVSRFDAKDTGMDGAVKLIKTVGGDFKNIKDAYQSLPTVNPAQPNAAKLLVTREDFEAALKQFRSLPEAVALKTQIDTFVAATQALNQKILDYTAFALRGEQIRAEVSQRNLELSRIKSTRALSQDVGLAEFAAFMSKLNAEAKNLLLKALYLESRAFNYWALTTSDFQVNDTSIEALRATHNRLIAGTLTELGKRNRGQQQFDFSEVVVEISKEDLPGAFATFVHNGRLDFAVPTNEFSITGRGLSMVYVSGVRITMEGLGTSDDEAVVWLIHSGRALFVDQNHQIFQYSHSPRPTRYAYTVSTGATVSSNDLNNLRGIGNDFADLSPLTVWTLLAPDQFNRNIDRTHVTKVRLQFSGFYMPINPNL